MKDKKTPATTDAPETRLPYEKPTVESDEVLERQVLGTGPSEGNPTCK